MWFELQWIIWSRTIRLRQYRINRVSIPNGYEICKARVHLQGWELAQKGSNCSPIAEILVCMFRRTLLSFRLKIIEHMQFDDLETHPTERKEAQDHWRS
ncbi:unnamed protein product [Cylicocyclus nassatus]|uniref:Uncharacterized protein n=1 Tax=Cylicocyclus nassatus TaxID=53992 RepID=A0AA36MIT0_CYLNA|nr:unnamed protein product [Cylicocyclus nassatus]